MDKGEIVMLSVSMVAILIVIIAIVAVFATLINNISYGDYEGIVVDKQYVAPHVNMIKSGKMTIPYTQPAHYRIKLQKEIDGEIKSVWIDVDSYIYSNIGIGDYYNKRRGEIIWKSF